MFSRAEIDESLALCHRAIELSEWLSKTAEIEFERFHEFMRWMKAGKSVLQLHLIWNIPSLV